MGSFLNVAGVRVTGVAGPPRRRLSKHSDSVLRGVLGGRGCFPYDLVRAVLPFRGGLGEGPRGSGGQHVHSRNFVSGHVEKTGGSQVLEALVEGLEPTVLQIFRILSTLGDAVDLEPPPPAGRRRSVR